MSLPKSLLFPAAAAAIGSLLLLATAQGIQPLKPIVVLSQGYPRPDQMMRVVEGTPFDVPAGKCLVVTGLGVANDPGNDSAGIFVRASFAGTEVINAQLRGLLIGQGSVTGTGPSIVPVPSGLVAAPGTQVSVTANLSTGVLLAYLEDA